jgi:hypothetical protein
MRLDTATASDAVATTGIQWSRIIHVVDDYGMSQVRVRNLDLSDQPTACSLRTTYLF